MSHFYGQLYGTRPAPVNRCATKNNGLLCIAAGWRGAVTVRLSHIDGRDRYEIALEPWHGSAGKTRILASGLLDAALNDE